jgi:hypothetical protein
MQDKTRVLELGVFNVHPYDEKLTLPRNMKKLRRARLDLRFRYARFVVVLVAT